MRKRMRLRSVNEVWSVEAPRTMIRMRDLPWVSTHEVPMTSSCIYSYQHDTNHDLHAQIIS